MNGESNFVLISENIKNSNPNLLIDKYLKAGTFAQIFGGIANYKKFIALSMAASVATGTSWMGHAVKQGSVVYILGAGYADFRRSLKAWRNYYGVQSFNGQLCVSSGPAMLTVHESVKAVKRSIDGFADKAGAPALIVFDTLNRNYGPGDWNGPVDMARVISNIDQYIRGTATVLFVCTTGYSEKNRGRENISLQQALDAEYQATTVRPGLCRMTCTKMKDAERLPDINLYMQEVMMEEAHGMIVDRKVATWAPS